MNMPAMEEWVDIHRQVRNQKRVLDLLAAKAAEWMELDDTKGDSLQNMLDYFLKTIGEKVIETIEAGWAHKPVDYSVLTFDGWAERVGQLIDAGELTLLNEDVDVARTAIQKAKAGSE